MSVSSVPLNGVNGGVFAFEEEPSAGALPRSHQTAVRSKRHGTGQRWRLQCWAAGVYLRSCCFACT